MGGILQELGDVNWRVISTTRDGCHGGVHSALSILHQDSRHYAFDVDHGGQSTGDGSS